MLRRTLLTLALVPLAAGPAQAQQATPRFGDAFWKRWGDGHAELAGYELTIPRYGAERRGTAITIFVTETFSSSLRVKADPGRHPAQDTFPVMKLNLVKDFPTGVYDYNMMLSSFVALRPVHGRPAGALTKVSFSSQEWCGHVYHQLLFDQARIRQQLHSYFDGEADQAEPLPVKAGGLEEDALFLWARGFAGPILAPGQELVVPLLMSTQHARLHHTPLRWLEATLERLPKRAQLTVPAGTFEADVLSARIGGDRSWTFHVEAGGARRLLQWESSQGERGQLLASKRLKYWQLNASGQERRLEELGLRPRPPRTP